MILNANFLLDITFGICDLNGQHPEARDYNLAPIYTLLFIATGHH